MEAYRKSILDYEDVRSAVDLAFEEGEERGFVKGHEEGEEKGREKGRRETWEEANKTFSKISSNGFTDKYYRRSDRLF